jgi:hypothetical protein
MLCKDGCVGQHSKKLFNINMLKTLHRVPTVEEQAYLYGLFATLRSKSPEDLGSQLP